MKYAYAAYCRTMIMHEFDECYTVDEKESESEYIPCDTIEQARAELARMRSEIDDPYTIEHTKRGLDTIEFYDLGIERLYWDENIEDWDYDDAYEDMDAVSTLPEEVKKRALESQRSYRAFLDWESDDYHGIED